MAQVAVTEDTVDLVDDGTPLDVGPGAPGPALELGDDGLWQDVPEDVALHIQCGALLARDGDVLVVAIAVDAGVGAVLGELFVMLRLLLYFRFIV